MRAASSGVMGPIAASKTGAVGVGAGVAAGGTDVVGASRGATTTAGPLSVVVVTPGPGMGTHAVRLHATARAVTWARRRRRPGRRTPEVSGRRAGTRQRRAQAVVHPSRSTRRTPPRAGSSVRDVRKIAPSNVVLIGLTSMFVDLSTEMVYPIVPLFLTATLGATPMVVGVIEGIAESLASLLKAFSGYIGDVRQHRKRLTFLGYSGSVVYKVLLLVAGSWGGVLIARVVDRVGKGIRTAPRDALIAQSSDPKKLGGSFGIAKMLDMAGSSVGALLAVIVVGTGTAYREAFAWSIVPAVIGLSLIHISEPTRRT